MRVVDVVVELSSSSAVSLKLLRELLLVLELHDVLHLQLPQLLLGSLVEVAEIDLLNLLERASSMH